MSDAPEAETGSKLMRPCMHNLSSHCTFHPDFPQQQKIACLSLCLRSHASFTHFIDTASTAHVLDHMTPSFMHQCAPAQGINCVYVTLATMVTVIVTHSSE